MARAAKLKVYRTAIGFHDAYVAASSQKAALQAWGSDKDLFARGVAELVTDEALMAEPLASPGKVIRRLRGTAEEQIAALPPDQPKLRGKDRPETNEPVIRRKRARAAREPRPSVAAPERAPPAKPAKRARSPKQTKPKPIAKPRPSRAALDDAEQAMRDLEERHAAELAEIRTREEAVRRERRDMSDRQEHEVEHAVATLADAERAYRDAITAWASG